MSWLRAAQEGVWVVSADEPALPAGAPAYDFRVIAGPEALLTEHGYRHGLRAILGSPGVAAGPGVVPAAGRPGSQAA